MKGIKECVNWMLDNPMKELQSTGCNNLRYNDSSKKFEHIGSILGRVYVLDCLDALEKYNWEEVIELVDFITAYQDVEQNHSVYISEYGNTMLEYAFNTVQIKIIGKTSGEDIGLLLGSTKWIKKVQYV